ncbi:hypothetical protein [Streptomyces sp. NPDC001492]
MSESFASMDDRGVPEISVEEEAALTNRLSPEREAEITARAEAATDGPWEEYPKYGKHFYAYLQGSYLRGVGTLNFGDGEDAGADRALTLNAREDIRALLAELSAVRAERDEAREALAFLERATLPELRRTVQHHIDGKQRWRERAESAEARISAVLDICDREQRNAMRWENPIPVPDWVAPVQRAALGDDKQAEAVS